MKKNGKGKEKNGKKMKNGKRKMRTVRGKGLKEAEDLCFPLLGNH